MFIHKPSGFTTPLASRSATIKTQSMDQSANIFRVIDGGSCGRQSFPPAPADSAANLPAPVGRRELPDHILGKLVHDMLVY